MEQGPVKVELANKAEDASQGYYLPLPDPFILKWVGDYLKKKRAGMLKSAVARAKKLGVDDLTIKEIEGGDIHVNPGYFRDILSHVYRCKLEDVLAKCFKRNKTHIFENEEKMIKEKHGVNKDHLNNREFEREEQYRLCFEPKEQQKPTPLFVAGQLGNFLFAVPYRRLAGQPLVTELLELAHYKANSGAIAENQHKGVEVITVIYGRVEFDLKRGKGRFLKHGDSVHFHARYPHRVKNLSTTSNALLQIVRLY